MKWSGFIALNVNNGFALRYADIRSASISRRMSAGLNLPLVASIKKKGIRTNE